MGGRGQNRGGNTVRYDDIRAQSDYVGDRNIENQVNDILRHNLGENEEWAEITDFRIVSNPGGGRVGDVEADYDVTIRTSYPEYNSDGTREEVFEEETERRTDIFQVVLRER